MKNSSDFPINWDNNNENDDNMNYEVNGENIVDDDIEELPNCPLTSIVLSSMIASKPFGINWSEEKMINFLKERGYKILKRHSNNRDEDYNVAIKSNSSFVPESDFGNIIETFNSEVEDIILNWLLTISKK